MLGYPVVRRVNHRRHNLVPQIVMHTGRMLPAQALEMLPPRLAFTGKETWMLQAQEDVLIVIGKRRAREPLDVLDDERPGPNERQNMRQRGKHIALIERRPREAAKREGLTRRTPSKEIHARWRRRPINRAHVTLIDRGPLNERIPRIDIRAQGITRRSVPFNSQIMGKAGQRTTEEETSTAREQLN